MIFLKCCQRLFFYLPIVSISKKVNFLHLNNFRLAAMESAKARLSSLPENFPGLVFFILLHCCYQGCIISTLPAGGYEALDQIIKAN